MVELIDSQKTNLETLTNEIQLIKNDQLQNLKLEWDRLQKDESQLTKDISVKQNAYQNLQKQLQESSQQHRKLTNFIND